VELYMIKLTYVSKSQLSEQFSFDDLYRILSVSRRNNSKSEVTGALILCGDNFAQLLEGPEESVFAIFDRIKVDKRHKEVTIVKKQTALERAFGEWSMAHPKKISQSPEQIAELFQDAFKRREQSSFSLEEILSDAEF